MGNAAQAMSLGAGGGAVPSLGSLGVPCHARDTSPRCTVLCCSRGLLLSGSKKGCHVVPILHVLRPCKKAQAVKHSFLSVNFPTSLVRYPEAPFLSFLC